MFVWSYAPWCPACKSLKSPWQKFANEDRTDELNIAEVDVAKYPGMSFCLSLPDSVYTLLCITLYDIFAPISHYQLPKQL